MICCFWPFLSFGVVIVASFDGNLGFRHDVGFAANKGH